MKHQDQDNDTDIHLLGTGTWLDWLPNLPRPVIALGENDIYSVFLNGKDFVLPIGDSDEPVVGFYTTRYVAARNFKEAKKAALDRVLLDWRNKGYLKLSGKEPSLTAEEVVISEKRFRYRSATGFAFYPDEDSD